MARMSTSGRLVLAAAMSLVLLAGCGSDDAAPAASGEATAAAEGSASRQVLLDAQELDALDQQVSYPKKTPAQVSSELITLEPGQETGWHRHRVPVYYYVMEGTLTVEYDAGVVKTYPAGTAYLEAEDVWHNTTNAGEDAVRMLAVYMGAEGAKNTVERAS
jgi:quercetin dioxygenase-like cupin family protein